MKLTISQFKKIALALFLLPLLATMLLSSVSVRTRAAAEGASESQDPAATYAAQRCAVCHGPKAEKKFNMSLPESELIDAILKGKKGEKPPFMPGYEAKGITADQAKALVDYMKQLAGPASE